MKKYIQCVQNDNENVTPQETIHAIKNAGFDGVFIQWYNRDIDFSQQEQLDLCRELNLEVVFAHLGYKGINNIWLDGEDGDNLVLGYLKDLDKCKINNISMVVMHLSSKANPPAPNLVGLKRIQQIVDHAEKLNIKIAFEFTRTIEHLEYIFSHISNSNIGVCYDAGHDHCYFNDMFDWDLFKNKILLVHLHDNDGSSDQHLLPYDGTIDWDLITKNLKKVNYNGDIILESCYRYDYLNISIDEFYKLSLERGEHLKL